MARANAEQTRLDESRARKAHWKRWGPYLSERAWGTVREDYSPYGTAWEYFPHDHARSRVYRWNEDGIAGVCDRHQRICLALAVWNERDPILKERLFGLTGNEGNHAEDVKECYFYLDSTPTHSYMRYLYKYPQREFPYADLAHENRRRSRREREYELVDTGAFDEHRYFDVFVEYAKASPEDLLMRVTACNRGPDRAVIHLLPTIWFRNRWSWGRPNIVKPTMRQIGPGAIALEEQMHGRRWLLADGTPELLFTENETNTRRLFQTEPATPFVKDGINDYVVDGVTHAVNPAGEGTKAAAHYRVELGPGESVSVHLRLTNRLPKGHDGPAEPDGRPAGPDGGPGLQTRAFVGADFDEVFAIRQVEAEQFWATVMPQHLSVDAMNVMRQAIGGMLWSKQFYHFIVRDWLRGDPTQPSPPPERRYGRNHDWPLLYNADIISMPDKWEYPWYASWDLAFHCVSLAIVDPDFAKDQLVLLLREWYMHPNGQLPAYEWAFGDVNPPVHAWAAWRVYKIEQKRRGGGDRVFLERVFHKLLLNFTWWVNRKDAAGRNVFQGGFLGLDNIGVFDRSAPLPTGGFLEQSDGTSWMAMYSLNMLAIAMELARHERAYEDVASKFWEHFLYIARAMNNRGNEGVGLWDEEDGFYYDVLHMPTGEQLPLKVRSMVGLIPLFAVETLEPGLLEQLPGFTRRLQWFVEHRPDLIGNVASMQAPGRGERRLLSVVPADRLRAVLRRLLDEREFLSPFGVRALSQVHREQPYVLHVDGHEHRVDYEPGESSTGLFGGNSNWRGPIWFPVNFLLVEALQKFHHYLGDEFTVECPTGSGQQMTLAEVAGDISRRLSRIFLRDEHGRRAVNGGVDLFDHDRHWREWIAFYEYFHGDSGAGVGASHQTGWTGLVAKLLQQSGERPSKR